METPKLVPMAGFELSNYRGYVIEWDEHIRMYRVYVREHPEQTWGYVDHVQDAWDRIDEIKDKVISEVMSKEFESYLGYKIQWDNHLRVYRVSIDDKIKFYTNSVEEAKDIIDVLEDKI